MTSIEKKGRKLKLRVLGQSDMSGLRKYLKVVHSKCPSTLYSNESVLCMDCPFHPYKDFSCPLDARETCSTKPCRFARVVKR